MAIVFSYRGHSTYVARYSGGGKQGVAFNSAKITTTTGGLSGTPTVMTDATQTKFLSFPAAYNTPNGRAMAFNVRIAPGYSGTPAASRAIWSLGAGMGTTTSYLELRHDTTTGNLTGIGKNELGNNTLAVITFGVWNPTSGTYYDIFFAWDGTTSANAVKLYVDGTLLGQGTASNALSSSWDQTYWKSLNFGANVNTTTSSYTLDEAVIWDSASVDPTSVTLDSGTGSLNGASRTSLITAADFDGRNSTDPGIANVKDGTSYYISGTQYTGTSSVLSTSTIVDAVWGDSRALTKSRFLALKD